MQSAKLLSTATLLILAHAAPTHAAAPAAKCESGKLKTASKYGACRLKAEAKAVIKGAPADHAKCSSKFNIKWGTIEAAAGAGICPTEGDGTSIDVRMADDASQIALLLSGGSLIPVGETPDAPAAVCADPPSPISALLEAQIAAAQLDVDTARAELFDPSVITVVMCGTGSPIPSDRAQACTAVFANGKFLLFDAGDGAQRSMEALNMPVDALSAIFITHFHSDHIADIGEAISRSWIGGRTAPLPVYGGTGVTRVVQNFNDTYAVDEVYRIAHHGETVFTTGTMAASAIEVTGADENGIEIFNEDGVTVHAYGVVHAPIEPALGYRVEFGGKSVVISGDTIDTAGLVNASAGADVLVSEVMNKSLIEETECALGRLGQTRNETIFRDIRTYHIDVAELGALAETAGVGTLVLTHQVPTLDGALAETFFTNPVAALFSGTLVTAVDGDRVVVPVD